MQAQHAHPMDALSEGAYLATEESEMLRPVRFSTGAQQALSEGAYLATEESVRCFACGSACANEYMV